MSDFIVTPSQNIIGGKNQADVSEVIIGRMIEPITWATREMSLEMMDLNKRYGPQPMVINKNSANLNDLEDSLQVDDFDGYVRGIHIVCTDKSPFYTKTALNNRYVCFKVTFDDDGNVIDTGYVATVAGAEKPVDTHDSNEVLVALYHVNKGEVEDVRNFLYIFDALEASPTSGSNLWLTAPNPENFERHVILSDMEPNTVEAIDNSKNMRGYVSRVSGMLRMRFKYKSWRDDSRSYEARIRVTLFSFLYPSGSVVYEKNISSAEEGAADFTFVSTDSTGVSLDVRSKANSFMTISDVQFAGCPLPYGSGVQKLL